MPDSVVTALEELPGRAARDWPAVDRALSHLAGADVHEHALLPAATCAVLAASSDTPFAAELDEPMRFRWRGIITPPVRAVAYDRSAEGVLRVRRARVNISTSQPTTTNARWPRRASCSAATPWT